MLVSKFILFICMIVIILISYKLWDYDMTYVMSDIDNMLYMVRNRQDKKEAANLLARLRQNWNIITNYMYDKMNNVSDNIKYKEFSPYIIQLKNKINDIVIRESTAITKYTSYTINKGEQIIFCIRSKIYEKIHDINLIMYVALHEISHVACPEYGHTDLFKKIFHFICQEAVVLKLYRPDNYNIQPLEYCGMIINESII